MGRCADSPWDSTAVVVGDGELFVVRHQHEPAGFSPAPGELWVPWELCPRTELPVARPRQPGQEHGEGVTCVVHCFKTKRKPCGIPCAAPSCLKGLS